MKYIAGHKDFINNAKQLIPNLSIFDKLILADPENTYKGILWDQKTNLNGKIKSQDEKIIYRSCYYIYLENHENSSNNNNPFSFIAKNTNNNLSLDNEFKTWGVVQIFENTYLFFI